jgi:hypothetical protein
MAPVKTLHAVILLLMAVLLGACATKRRSSHVVTTVAPPRLEVKKTVMAADEVRTATATVGAEVSALKTTVVSARKEAAALAETVKKVKKDGAAAQSALANDLADQSKQLTFLLDESDERATRAETAHRAATAAVHTLTVEVTALQERAGAQEQAIAQFQSESKGLRALNEVLAKDREDAIVEAAKHKERARKWRNCALVIGVTVLIAGALWLMKLRARLPV